ncbi:MAG: hypothetical protein K9J76_09790 [Polaromonas sp.]|nr:hypothetical protein [Polaromonas sp.]
MFTIKQPGALTSPADGGIFLLAEEDDHDEEPEFIYGTNQADIINAGGGPQHIIADNGDDQVFAGGGPDVVEGGNGHDTLTGGGGPDIMYGGNGDDVLIGGAGPDTLFGDNGDDVLTGGEGPDMLTGGRGADTFVYLARSDAPARGDEDEHEGVEGEEGGHEDDGGHDDGGPKVETITDFKAGVDKIDFTTFDSLVAFSADGPMANAIWVEQVGESTVVMVDLQNGVDGEHPAELSILLLGVNAADLSTADFLF